MINQFIKQKLYQPLQMSIRPSEHLKAVYREYIPVHPLQNYVYCYWMIQTKKHDSEPFLYRIMTDGCVDLLLNCSNEDPLILAGTAEKADSVSIKEHTEYFGIRFFPGCIHYFFQVSAKEIANQEIPCKDIWGNQFEYIEGQLRDAGSVDQRITITNTFLLNFLKTCKSEPDQRLLNALDIIYQRKGHLSVEKDVSIGISPRHMRRIFNQYIGTSPKKFSKIIRFQYVLRNMMVNSKNLSKGAYLDFGYYDQPHFIKEFKALSGVTPNFLK
ncbi:MAG: AraC family transcriptional regulator [Deltaproteobacteria bacterium]|nr:AraC family transcriptional regulator [Deltaproteobacteria bacterium]